MQDNAAKMAAKPKSNKGGITVRVATTCVKMRLGSKSQNLVPILQLIDKAVEAGQPDILVLSESVFTRMNIHGIEDAALDTSIAEELDGPVFKELMARAAQHKIYIAFTIYAPGGDADAAPRAFFNSNFLLSPEGEIVGRYDKNKLPKSEAEAGCKPGTERPVFDISVDGKAVRVGMMNCYDFSLDGYCEGEERVAASLANKGAKILLGSSIGDYTSEAVSDAAANGVYVVMAGQDKYRENDYGASAIIDPKGGILVQFTDRTGYPGLDMDVMRYRPGQDGSYGYADIVLPL